MPLSLSREVLCSLSKQFLGEAAVGTSSQFADRQGGGQAPGPGLESSLEGHSSRAGKEECEFLLLPKKRCVDLLCCTLTVTAAAACRSKNAMGIPVV